MVSRFDFMYLVLERLIYNIFIHLPTATLIVLGNDSLNALERAAKYLRSRFIRFKMSTNSAIIGPNQI